MTILNLYVMLTFRAVPDKSQSGALLFTWLSAHSKMILAGVIPKLFQIALLFTQPLLVERAISFAATPNRAEFNNIGYGLIGAYALVYSGIAVRVFRTQALCTNKSADAESSFHVAAC